MKYLSLLVIFFLLVCSCSAQTSNTEPNTTPILENITNDNITSNDNQTEDENMDLYFVLATGINNWGDNSTWSTTPDGLGVPHAPPGAGDNVYPSSLIASGATLSINADANCNNMDWTGVTNNPCLAGGSSRYLTIYGNLIFSANMTMTFSGILVMAQWAPQSLTTNGLTISCNIALGGDNTSTKTLLDDLNMPGKTFYPIQSARIDTNDKTVTCGTFNPQGTGGIINLGASIINCNAWIMGAGNTLNAGTSVIKVTGTGTFSGGGYSYNEVQLNDVYHAVDDTNTFAILSGNSTIGQSIYFSDGTTQTITGSINLSGSSNNFHTLRGSSNGGWTISKVSGTVATGLRLPLLLYGLRWSCV